jgi:flagellar hook-basal body complex protein FliE
MRVEALIPDTAVVHPRASTGAFAALVDAASSALTAADAAETAFATHRGGLQEMVVERARADIALQVAAAGTQHAAQALQSLLGMQI